MRSTESMISSAREEGVEKLKKDYDEYCCWVPRDNVPTDTLDACQKSLEEEMDKERNKFDRLSDVCPTPCANEEHPKEKPNFDDCNEEIRLEIKQKKEDELNKKNQVYRVDANTLKDFFKSKCCAGEKDELYLQRIRFDGTKTYAENIDNQLPDNSKTIYQQDFNKIVDGDWKCEKGFHKDQDDINILMNVCPDQTVISETKNEFVDPKSKAKHLENFLEYYKEPKVVPVDYKLARENRKNKRETAGTLLSSYDYGEATLSKKPTKKCRASFTGKSDDEHLKELLNDCGIKDDEQEAPKKENVKSLLSQEKKEKEFDVTKMEEHCAKLKEVKKKKPYLPCHLVNKAKNVPEALIYVDGTMVKECLKKGLVEQDQREVFQPKDKCQDELDILEPFNQDCVMKLNAVTSNSIDYQAPKKYDPLFQRDRSYRKPKTKFNGTSTYDEDYFDQTDNPCTKMACEKKELRLNSYGRRTEGEINLCINQSTTRDPPETSYTSDFPFYCDRERKVARVIPANAIRLLGGFHKQFKKPGTRVTSYQEDFPKKNYCGVDKTIPRIQLKSRFYKPQNDRKLPNSEAHDKYVEKPVGCPIMRFRDNPNYCLHMKNRKKFAGDSTYVTDYKEHSKDEKCISTQRRNELKRRRTFHRYSSFRPNCIVEK
ncbi:hypothetical protein SNEBB_009303 [Seison nebaliae]|nr:hypothetical protein SNEBB_009303 [Seison nebaliae]